MVKWFPCLLVTLSACANGNPFPHPSSELHRRQLNLPPQPGQNYAIATGSTGNQQKSAYWWQGNDSPFSGGRAVVNRRSDCNDASHHHGDQIVRDQVNEWHVAPPSRNYAHEPEPANPVVRQAANPTVRQPTVDDFDPLWVNKPNMLNQQANSADDFDALWYTPEPPARTPPPRPPPRDDFDPLWYRPPAPQTRDTIYIYPSGPQKNVAAGCTGTGCGQLAPGSQRVNPPSQQRVNPPAPQEVNLPVSQRPNLPTQSKQGPHSFEPIDEGVKIWTHPRQQQQGYDYPIPPPENRIPPPRQDPVVAEPSPASPQTVSASASATSSGGSASASASAHAHASASASASATASASAHATASATATSNYWWQQPANPCSNHIGPDCPSTYVCTQYNLCVGGTVIKAAKTTIAKPKLEDLMLFGRPCNNDGVSVCCRQPAGPPPTEPVIAEPDRIDPVIVLPPRPAPPPTQAPIVVVSTQRPIVAPPPTAQPVAQVPQPSAPLPQTLIPLPPLPAAETPRVPEPSNGIQQPYPGCAAALKCVLNEFCSVEGIMVDKPVSANGLNSLFRVPLSTCFNTETGLNGVCCRDPLYEDPWPADMPMPAGMPPKVMPPKVMPQQPVLPPRPPVTQPPPPPPRPVVEPIVAESPSQQSSVVLCSSSQECVLRNVCTQRTGQSVSSAPMCRMNTGILGLCCSSEPTRVDSPDLTYLPPPPPQSFDQTYLPPPQDLLPPPSSGYGRR